MKMDWMDWNGLNVLDPSTSLIFEKKKKHSYLRVTNFIPDIYNISYLKINYFKLILKKWNSNLDPLDYESSIRYITLLPPFSYRWL